MESMDDRITPSTSPFQSFVYQPFDASSDVATHFRVYTSPTAYLGEPTRVIVVALDATNHIDRNYAGTIAITSSDANATLPANYTFTAADHGIHFFSETFATLGAETLTATDISNSSITGAAFVTVDADPVATHFEILVKPQVYAGEETQVVVVALDASNHVVKDYTGTVSLASSDANATLPASYTFTASDNGIHVFDLTMGSTGSQTLSATDNSNNALTGSISITVNPTQVATHFEVLARHAAFSGSPEQVMVVALDASNNVVQNFTGTVSLTSSDANAKLPASYTFTTADRGVHIFSVTLSTMGTQTISATDANNSTLTGTVSIDVHPPLPSKHGWRSWF
jgi:hypothetical protein